MANCKPVLGIVLVSHSKTLVDGLLDLLNQMNHDNVPISVAGGTDNVDNPIGTDVSKVLSAIQEVLKKDIKAVIVFMDIGSALMATEAALEFLSETERSKVWISEGAIVEGSIIALGSALSNLSIKDICKDVSLALKIKEQQLKPYLKHIED